MVFHYLLGVCFIAEGVVRRNTFERSTQKQSRSYHPGSFDIVTHLKTKGGTDLKMKIRLTHDNLCHDCNHL
jgi:hypothetical protein